MIASYFIMKDVHNSSILPQDPDGCLYDPEVRAALARFARDDNTLTLEAAAAVRAAAHAVEHIRGRGAQSRGLSSGALDILLRLDTGSDDLGTSIGELAQSAGVTPRNVTGLVDTLEREGLAQRTQDPSDRRSVLVTITPAGRGRIDAFRRPTQLAMGAIFHGFSPADIAQLRHLCLRLVAGVRRVEEHRPGPQDEPPSS